MILTVSKIKNLKDNGDNTSLLEIGFENYTDTALMFANYADTLSYQDQQVDVTFREEVVEGYLRNVINQLALITRVSTIDKDTRVKLYQEGKGDLYSNIAFQDIAVGDSYPRALLYCTKVQFESSSKATWADLYCLDSKRQSARVKLFAPDRQEAMFNGKYLELNIKRTAYGFQTDEVRVAEYLELSVNPEITLAEKYILSVMVEYPSLLDLIESKQLLHKLKINTYGEDIELGYELVRLAMELSFILEMSNLVETVDIELLVTTAIVRRIHMISFSDKTSYSKELLTILQLTNTKLINNPKVIAMIEASPSIAPKEKEIYESVKNLVSTLVKSTKLI